MNLDDFQFNLPKDLIAQEPANPRDAARLLVYKRSDKKIVDSVFRDINDHLVPGTSLVRNVAKVDKARLLFNDLEVFVLETFNDRTVNAMVRPGRKFKLGAIVQLSKEISAEVTAINEHGHRTLVFNSSLDNSKFDKHKHTPLPPYIKQNETLADEYQTVYAQKPGSKAAPTAGLHFTSELLERVGESHEIIDIALDVGLGTFAPIDENDIATKKLHKESYSISPESSRSLRASQHRTAVGTTSVRVIESASRSQFAPCDDASTDIFIQPGDQLLATDSLITNFHLPSTSLLMLVATFTGRDELMRIYKHAIEQRYRFYSFGDAMLVI